MSKNIKYITEYTVFGSDDYEEARQHIGEEGCFTDSNFVDYFENLEAPIASTRGTLTCITLLQNTTWYHQQHENGYLYFLLPVKEDLISQNSQN